MAHLNNDSQQIGEETLAGDIKNIIGGVATIVAIVIPIIIIRKLVKKIENSDSFKAVENTLG